MPIIPHGRLSCIALSPPCLFSSMMTQPALDTVQPIQPVPIRVLMMSSVVADKTLSMKKKTSKETRVFLP